MARELGWGAERLQLELERFAEEARLEGILAGDSAGAHTP
jgi:hypothetical protein